MFLPSFEGATIVYYFLCHVSNVGTPASGAIAADDSGGAVGGDGFNLASECLNEAFAKTLHAVPQRFRPDQMPRVLLEFEPSSCQQIPERLSCLNVNDYLRKANPGFFHTLHSESEAP